MSCVEGAVIAQVPGPNQYWEHIKSKDRAYFIGRDPDGMMVFQCEGDAVEVGNLDWSGWRHIPGCTGWDWEPDQVDEFPQYYVGTGWVDATAYVVRSSPNESHAVDKWGGTFWYAWDDIAKSFIERGTLVRVTEAEAMARLDKPAAEETYPQYWTTRNLASYLYVVVESPTVWKAVTTAGNIEDWTHRTFSSESRTRLTEQEALALLDKRKDLPPVPAPAVETFPQWYILKDDERRSWVPDWTITRTGEETAIRYARDEAGELYATAEQWTGAAECWQRCSDAEAIVRIGTSMFTRVPSEPRRVPVKLWVTYRLNDEGGDWPVRATQADQTCQNWKEIKFDGNGAFIEVDG